MKSLKKFIKATLKTLLFLYLVICIGLYFFQEKLIFFPRQLPSNFEFSFQRPFKEVQIPVDPPEQLNGLWFKQDSSKGLIFYLHGNAGALNGWGRIAPIYLNLGYDIFLLDYRGFGKSTGSIYSEAQFFGDAQKAYDWAKQQYPSEKITIIGYSIGTGVAAYLAANNEAQQLILKAPYYSLVDMMQAYYAFIPTFLLKYRFETYRYLPQITVPISIFHGDQDQVIPFNSSVRLQKLLKPTDQFIALPKAGHNGMNYHPQYINFLKTLL